MINQYCEFYHPGPDRSRFDYSASGRMNRVLGAGATTT
jgi:hypothetical protein